MCHPSPSRPWTRPGGAGPGGSACLGLGPPLGSGAGVPSQLWGWGNLPALVLGSPPSPGSFSGARVPSHLWVLFWLWDLSKAPDFSPEFWGPLHVLGSPPGFGSRSGAGVPSLSRDPLPALAVPMELCRFYPGSPALLWVPKSGAEGGTGVILGSAAPGRARALPGRCPQIGDTPLLKGGTGTKASGAGLKKAPGLI